MVACGGTGYVNSWMRPHCARPSRCRTPCCAAARGEEVDGDVAETRKCAVRRSRSTASMATAAPRGPERRVDVADQQAERLLMPRGKYADRRRGCVVRLQAVPEPSAMKMASGRRAGASPSRRRTRLRPLSRHAPHRPRRVTVRDRPAGARARSARRSRSRTCACRCRARRPGARSPQAVAERARGRIAVRRAAATSGMRAHCRGRESRDRWGCRHPPSSGAWPRIRLHARASRGWCRARTQSGPPVRRAPPKIRAARRATPRGARRRPEVSVTGRAEVTFIASG